MFGDSRADQRRWRAEIGAWLATERGLRLKHPQARVLACAGHLDALGYRLTRDDRRALQKTLRRLKARVQAHLRGEPVDIARSLQASAGSLRF